MLKNISCVPKGKDSKNTFILSIFHVQKFWTGKKGQNLQTHYNAALKESISQPNFSLKKFKSWLRMMIFFLKEA